MRRHKSHRQNTKKKISSRFYALNLTTETRVGNKTWIKWKLLFWQLNSFEWISNDFPNFLINFSINFQIIFSHFLKKFSRHFWISENFKVAFLFHIPFETAQVFSNSELFPLNRREKIFLVKSPKFTWLFLVFLIQRFRPKFMINCERFLLVKVREIESFLQLVLI
jgi:hypothetical protein